VSVPAIKADKRSENFDRFCIRLDVTRNKSCLDVQRSFRSSCDLCMSLLELYMCLGFTPDLSRVTVYLSRTGFILFYSICRCVNSIFTKVPCTSVQNKLFRSLLMV
jgi:hypothetical protein